MKERCTTSRNMQKLKRLFLRSKETLGEVWVQNYWLSRGTCSKFKFVKFTCSLKMIKESDRSDHKLVSSPIQLSNWISYLEKMMKQTYWKKKCRYVTSKKRRNIKSHNLKITFCLSLVGSCVVVRRSCTACSFRG